MLGTRAIGTYTLLRLARGGLEPGTPGQLFMLEAPGRVLPRAFSLCLAPDGELGFLIDPIGPGTRALAGLAAGDAIHVLGPLGRGFDLSVERPLLVGGGIGIAPLPYLSERLGGAAGSARLPQRAACRSSLPPARRRGRASTRRWSRRRYRRSRETCSRCGPEPMLRALARLVPDAQLAWEAPMACGYGACYGCVVEIEGRYRRLCVDGPVLRGHQVSADG